MSGSPGMTVSLGRLIEAVKDYLGRGWIAHQPRLPERTRQAGVSHDNAGEPKGVQGTFVLLSDFIITIYEGT